MGDIVSPNDRWPPCLQQLPHSHAPRADCAARPPRRGKPLQEGRSDTRARPHPPLPPPSIHLCLPTLEQHQRSPLPQARRRRARAAPVRKLGWLQGSSSREPRSRHTRSQASRGSTTGTHVRSTEPSGDSSIQNGSSGKAARGTRVGKSCPPPRKLARKYSRRKRPHRQSPKTRTFTPSHAFLRAPSIFWRKSHA